MTAAAPAAAPHTAPAGPASPSVGRTALGTITIDDSVVAKIASRAAAEIPDAGAAATRLLGRSLPGAGVLGTRPDGLAARPKASAEVDGGYVFITLTLGVRWPCSVAAVTHAVRHRVHERVTELTGLHVAEVTIEVTSLLPHLTPPPRPH